MENKASVIKTVASYTKLAIMSLYDVIFNRFQSLLPYRSLSFYQNMQEVTRVLLVRDKDITEIA